MTKSITPGNGKKPVKTSVPKIHFVKFAKNKVALDPHNKFIMIRPTVAICPSSGILKPGFPYASLVIAKKPQKKIVLTNIHKRDSYKES